MGALTCYQNAKSRQEALVLGFWRAPVIPNQLELLLGLDERPLICLLSVYDSRLRERRGTFRDPQSGFSAEPCHPLVDMC
jgi:hypothetical protein